MFLAARTELAPAPAGWTLRGLYLATGLSCAAIAPFSAVILSAHGLDAFAIGFVSAVAALAGTLIVPAWGHLGDVLIGRASAFRLGLVIASGAAIALLLPLPIAAVAAVVASFAVFVGLFLGLGDALAVNALAKPERQYGPLRALASFSFAVGVIAAGFLYNVLGYGAAPVASLITSALLFVLIARLPDPTANAAVRQATANHGGASAAGRFGSVSRAFAVQPRLLAVLVVLTFTYTGLQGAVTFVGLRIVQLGGQPSDVALTFGIASFTEIPGLVAATWLARRVGLRWVFVASAVAYGLLVASWGLLPSPVAINLTRLGTGLCFGALAAARVLLIARILPGPLQATGQGLVQATTFGLGTVIGNVIGGLEYGSLGPTAFFATAGVIAVIGGLGAWIALEGPAGARAATAGIGP